MPIFIYDYLIEDDCAKKNRDVEVKSLQKRNLFRLNQKISIAIAYLVERKRGVKELNDNAIKKENSCGMNSELKDYKNDEEFST